MNQKTLTYYLLFFISASFLSLGFFLYTPGQDHPGAITLHGNKTWYMNFRRTNIMQVQDRDILYHHIGKSIDYAKKADIIILGHSMALFGIDWELIEAFEKKYQIKIYNMASASDASGEFLLRTVEKYKLHPSIWVINADDHENSFFKNFLQNGAKGTAQDVVDYSKWQAFKNILSKNIKWKTEMLMRYFLPGTLVNLIYPQTPIYNYRSVISGNWNNSDWPGYNAENATFVNDREPNCHALKEEYEWADQYVNRLHTGDIVLTQIPHTRSCRPRVQEIAAHLKAPFISVDWHGMTSFDRGGHLDHAGAKKFTTALLHQLEQTDAFKKLIRERNKQS